MWAPFALEIARSRLGRARKGSDRAKKKFLWHLNALNASFAQVRAISPLSSPNPSCPAFGRMSSHPLKSADMPSRANAAINTPDRTQGATDYVARLLPVPVWS